MAWNLQGSPRRFWKSARVSQSGQPSQFSDGVTLILSCSSFRYSSFHFAAYGQFLLDKSIAIKHYIDIRKSGIQIQALDSFRNVAEEMSLDSGHQP